MRTGLYVISCLAAALVGLLPDRPAAAPAADAFPGWPREFQGRPLTRLPLSQREERFAEGFPGRIARFTDGSREVIFRWVAAPTRMLHPAAECFRALGYRIDPLPIHVDAAGRRWSTFRATRGSEALQVRQRVYDAAGNTWPDASAWYWSALLGHTAGPWWAVTVAQADNEEEGR